MFVCICKAVRLSDVKEILTSEPGAGLERVQSLCGAGTDCGSCVAKLTRHLHESAEPNNSEVPLVESK